MGDLFVLKEKYYFDRPIIKQDFVQYKLSNLATVNNTNSAINVNIPRADAYITLQNSFLG